MYRFRSFQGRLLFFVLGLLALVQSAVFLTVDVANARHARAQIESALEDGVRRFRRLIDARTVQLGESVRILAGDFAFKAAVATGDMATIGSALRNHGSRVGADAMLLLSLDRKLVAAAPERLAGGGALPPALLELLRRADAGEAAAATAALADEPFQLLVLPVLAPDPVAWIVAGFAIDDRLARELRESARLETSFVARSVSGAAQLYATSFPADARPALAAALAGLSHQAGMASMRLAEEEYLGRVMSLDGVEVVLQRSLTRELAPFRELRLAVLAFSVAGLVLSALGAWLVARSVTRPVLALADAARAAEEGDYARTVMLEQRDELGALAAAFNRMMRGLAERDRVRSLLGKVVSREIAEKLLSREVELGGEEREVTVLFCDLRGFTALSEKRSAHDTVALLNAFFTRMTAVVEAHHGVVDKYLGDGMMALFGAPFPQGDDAGNALAAALDMMQALAALNRELAPQGVAALDMGIGINTAVVVAGNLGSPNRLNYTVIGDGVNLASRLEGLSKRAGVEARIVVSRATLEKSARRFRTRPLGPSLVRGKAEAVEAFALLGVEDGAHDMAGANRAA